MRVSRVGGPGPLYNVLSFPLLLDIFPLFFPCAFLCLASSRVEEKGKPSYNGRVPWSVTGECRSGTGFR